MLEHDRELAVDVTATRAAESDLVPDHILQLECDMLYDVRGVSASLQTSDESAGLTNAATVVLETRHRSNEKLGEPRYVRGRNCRIRSNGNVHPCDGPAGPVIRPARSMERRDSELDRRVGQRHSIR